MSVLVGVLWGRLIYGITLACGFEISLARLHRIAAPQPPASRTGTVNHCIGIVFTGSSRCCSGQTLS